MNRVPGVLAIGSDKNEPSAMVAGGSFCVENHRVGRWITGLSFEKEETSYARMGATWQSHQLG